MGVKRFKCVQCPAKFVSKGNLQAHMATHDSKKPYACNVCGSSFTQSYSLVKHNRIHTGERPFEVKFYVRYITERQTSSSLLVRVLPNAVLFI